MAVIVQKYGGSSLKTPAHIDNVAGNVAKLYSEGHKVLVVVSAMGNTTNELTSLAHEVSPKPKRRELDMLLTAGERISMSLMSMRLNDLGVPAVSFTGSQAGIMTDGDHNNAQIKEIKPQRIQETLDEGKVAVLAGFQGVNPTTKEVTTLGRGGSDTTAVAMASHFKAERCEMRKDVTGVCSADPKLIDQVTSHKKLNYEHLSHMCFWGSQVLHHRATELAQKLQVPLFIGSATKQELCTEVGTNLVEDLQQVLSINSHKLVERVELNAHSIKEAVSELEGFAVAADVSAPQVLFAELESNKCTICFTNNEASLKPLVEYVTQKEAANYVNDPLCSVTLTGHKLTSSEFQKQALEAINKQNINAKKLHNDSYGLTLFLDSKNREKAIEALHKELI